MKILGEDEQTINTICGACSGDKFTEYGGFYYCQECGTQAQGFILANVTDDDLYNLYNVRFSRRISSSTTNEPDPCSLAWYQFIRKEEEEDEKVTTSNPPSQISHDDYSNEVRFRYVIGLQTLIQSQCDALIQKFGLSDLIPGIASWIWLRYVVVSGVLKDDWASDAILKSESESDSHMKNKKKLVADQSDADCGSTSSNQRYYNEPLTAHGKRAVSVWFRSLKKAIPMDHTLAICYLACHIAKEAVLPTDLAKWSIEGTIPYFNVHLEIESKLGAPSFACPISSASMFRTTRPIPFDKLEGMAATIAESLGLSLTPINFYAIACRYLNQLSIPSEKVITHACRIYEWSMPPDLLLSKSEVPTRVCVVSILIVAIRILYNLNGFGAWERSIGKKSQVDSDEALLQRLEAGYSMVGESWEFGKDLTSYLNYCTDVVFEKGTNRSSSLEDEFIEKLWDYYIENAANDDDDDDDGNQEADVERSSIHSRSNVCSRNEEAALIRKLKLDMKEKEFGYLVPRVNIKNTTEYLHYSRRKDETTGRLRYVAHADYYILLRSCAKVAQVDCKMMHLGVLALERRLDSLEKRIHSLLHPS